MATLDKITEAVIEGNSEKVKENVEKAIEENLNPDSIINDGLISGMAVVGKRFKNFEIYVPEVLIAARAMRSGMHILQPYIVNSDTESKGLILIGTVKGDLHDIGKNLVIMMLEGSGYKVIDMGIDVSAGKFVEAVKEHKPKVVGLSALLTTTMPEIKNSLEKLKSYDPSIIVIVGGAPVTQAYADSIGADGYAPDAASAVDTVNMLVGQSAV